MTNLHILCDNQFGSRKIHSTTLALIDLPDKILSALDNGELAVGIFLCLSKAFDTVNRSIFFNKLEHYSIHGLALKWIKRYFLKQTSICRIQWPQFLCIKISCGVPQNSISGPLFIFLLYTTTLLLILFADDTNAFLSHKDADCLVDILNTELNKLNANRPSLNIKKTKFMVFKPSQKHSCVKILLLINGHKLDQVKETIF